MSRETFRGSSSYTIAEIDIDPQRISGFANGPDTLLWINVEFHFWRPNPGQAVDHAYRLLTGHLATQNGARIATLNPVNINSVLLHHHMHRRNEYCNLHFPLDPHRLDFIEKTRNGEDLNLRLLLWLEREEYAAIQDNEGKHPAYWSLRSVEQMTLDTHITIPKSNWIDRVLSNIGYGKIHLFELPVVPVEAAQKYAHAFEALKQAQERHKLGQYDDAVGKCRVALEEFFEKKKVVKEGGEQKEISVLKSSWQKKLGSSTYDWLNGAMDALKYAGNKPHHSAHEHYDYYESLMIISITLAVVGFAARSDTTESQQQVH